MPRITRAESISFLSPGSRVLCTFLHIYVFGTSCTETCRSSMFFGPDDQSASFNVINPLLSSSEKGMLDRRIIRRAIQPAGAQRAAPSCRERSKCCSSSSTDFSYEPGFARISAGSITAIDRIDTLPNSCADTCPSLTCFSLRFF